VSNGGHLATITSQGENDAVVELFKNIPGKGITTQFYPAAMGFEYRVRLMGAKAN
jgi:hypothetical protein